MKKSSSNGFLAVMLSWVLTAAVDGHADSAVQAVSLANPTLLAPASGNNVCPL